MDNEQSTGGAWSAALIVQSLSLPPRLDESPGWEWSQCALEIDQRLAQQAFCSAEGDTAGRGQR